MENQFKFGLGQQKLLAECLSNDLDAHTATIYDDGHRNHLGASMIGDDCLRKLWYSFRWVLKASFVDKNGKDNKGRMLRLFNRGHKEEFRFVDWLRGMGHTVEEYDMSLPLKDGKPQQFRISDVMGHYGGSCDGKITLHGKYEGLPTMLLEFKTSSSKYFDKLKENGVRIDKPIHYSQMCSYGKRFGLRYALYMCVNKDNDEIHIEIVELDWNEADHMTGKASTIINSPVPPPKISENSAYFKCKMCDKAPVCHGRVKYDVNCRSCKFAQPVANAEWFCHKFQNIIPKDFIKSGCGQHEEAR